MNIPDGLLPNVFSFQGGLVCFTPQVPNSNIAYRIANFLHMMRGSNELRHLSRYSEHIIENSDNLTNLRGAYGPRLRNWIGSHQLQEMINMNAELIDLEPAVQEDTDEEFPAPPAFAKPAGIDQMMAVYDDLSMGMGASTLVVRDPAIDFDETDDVPDLTSITYIEKLVGGKPTLVAYGNYQNIFEDNFWNESWAICLLSQIYHAMLDYPANDVTRDLEVLFTGCNMMRNQVATEDYFVNCQDADFNGLNHSSFNSETFWDDLDKLQKLSDHIQGYLNPSTFSNPDVSTERCEAALEKIFMSTMEDPVLSDMANALAVWAFWTYGNASQVYAGDYEGTILRILEGMSDSFITKETKMFLLSEETPFSIRSACE